MDNARRNFLKLGTGAAVGSLMASPVVAKTEILLPASADGREALRLVTFSPQPGTAPRVGVVTAEGMVVDVGAAARAQNMTLELRPVEHGLADRRRAAGAGPGAALRGLREHALRQQRAALRANSGADAQYLRGRLELSRAFPREPDGARRQGQAAGASGVLHQGHAYGERPVRPDPVQPRGLDG